ncbi:MAG: formate dehydrogenase accessory sulfurtransferase FdhD [Candidatus Adiutrix sp.]|jgi:FdhD protein|nr:formate dehydrogenase accessory sulfurtransferase FdhD [Candidatus Adiutrix sp.]
MENSWVTRRIIRINANGSQVVDDRLLREETYSIFRGEEKVAALNCLPLFLEQLAVGHLFSRDMLRDRGDIARIRTDTVSRAVQVDLRTRPAEKQREPGEEITLTVENIHRLQESFNERCDLFRQTGAAHGCALAEPGGITIFMEDVARHNALDKVIGEMVLAGLSPAGKALIFSGRLALDMLEKASRGGVKLLIAPGAPSSAAVEHAERDGLTLLGFVRRDNVNIYTHPRRVSYSQSP